MSFRNFSTGNSHSFEGGYLELVSNQLIAATPTSSTIPTCPVSCR
jgi:hypothetical protein